MNTSQFELSVGQFHMAIYEYALRAGLLRPDRKYAITPMLQTGPRITVAYEELFNFNQKEQK